MLVNTKSTDYDLIDIITDKEDPFCKEAFVLFHERHASFIYNTCLDFCKSRIDREADAKDLTQEVFKKIISKSKSFRRKKNITNNDIVNHVRKWLYTVIRNTFLDQYVKPTQIRPSSLRITDENQDIIAWDFHENLNQTNVLSDFNKERYFQIIGVIKALKLNKKQRDVLKAYVESGQFDSLGKNWNLPDYRMEELMSKYDLKRNSIIKIKDRIIEKIQAYIKKPISN